MDNYYMSSMNNYGNNGNIGSLYYERKGHRWPKILLIVSTILLFILTIIFNGLQANKSNGLFLNSAGDVSNKFYVDITPAGWVFGIWGFIYAWQGLWLLYSFICIFRRTSNGYYLYLTPNFLHSGIFLVFIINLLANITWLFLWSYEHLGWALLLICILTFSLYIALFISYRQLNKHEYVLRANNYTVDVWLVRFLIQNGLAFYATWVSIASNLNFAIYISYRLGASRIDASTAALSLILAAILLYFVLENFVLPNYFLYTFSPWIVLIVALIGIITKNWQKNNPTRNNIFALVLLIVVVVLILIRIIMFILYKTILRKRVNTQTETRNIIL